MRTALRLEETDEGGTFAAGATWRLAELVGEPVATEILLAGRVLDAEEALAVRLVSGLAAAGELGRKTGQGFYTW